MVERLSEEADTSKHALQTELHNETSSKADLESQIAELNAGYQSQLEVQERKFKEMMEDLKHSKEEDLERLRAMYEEHIDATKKRQGDVESDLKEEIECLLEENEKVKRYYDTLEGEMGGAKKELEGLNGDYQKALSGNIRLEKEGENYKEEVNDLLASNDKLKKSYHVLDEEANNVKDDLERMTSSYQRADAEKIRFERELNLTSKEKDDAIGSYNDLSKKLAGIQ